MKYPMVKPWLCYMQISDDEYEVDNEIIPNDLDEDPLILPGCFIRFMQKLDGRTNPFSIDPSIDKKTVKSILHFLSKQGLLREKVRNRDLGRFTFPIIKFNAVQEYSRSTVILNRCLLLSWLPALVAGCILVRKTYYLLDISGHAYIFCLIFGFIFGGIVGLVLHEAGHVVSARSYMAPVYEVGIKLGILPTAYTFMKETVIKNRFKRAQVYAAGVESNFLIAGLFSALAYIIQHGDLRTFFFYAAVENIVSAILNLCFFMLLDGFKIVTTLIGADDMIWSMLVILITPSIWKEEVKKGASGLAEILCVVFFQLSQIIVVIWIVYNVGIFVL